LKREDLIEIRPVIQPTATGQSSKHATALEAAARKNPFKREFFNRCAGRPARSRWCKSTTMKE
jgi:hypothetical protein